MDIDTIKKRLDDITPTNKWTIEWHGDKTSRVCIGDYTITLLDDDADFIFLAPATIKSLLDEVARLTDALADANRRIETEINYSNGLKITLDDTVGIIDGKDKEIARLKMVADAAIKWCDTEGGTMAGRVAETELIRASNALSALDAGEGKG